MCFFPPPTSTVTGLPVRKAGEDLPGKEQTGRALSCRANIMQLLGGKSASFPLKLHAERGTNAHITTHTNAGSAAHTSFPTSQRVRRKPADDTQLLGVVVFSESIT